MYSRLVSWEVKNFMSISDARVEFDGTGIVNFKGYNDSGKSAMLLALKVLLTNTDPTKQADFIQDDKEYFRVVAYFDDGVAILRDKYIGGQSLYEMYKDGQLLFSTKQGRVLTKVVGVPDVIAEYLGLIVYDGGTLNARACFEKQIGVQTTGSENYVMFNTVLRSEEIASASEMLNNDRNKLASDISAMDASLQTLKSMYRPGLTESLLDGMDSLDGSIDAIVGAEAHLEVAVDFGNRVRDVPIWAELCAVDGVGMLAEAERLHEEAAGCAVWPELGVIKGVEDITGVAVLDDEMRKCAVWPEIDVVGDARMLSAIVKLRGSLDRCPVWQELSGVAGLSELGEVLGAWNALEAEGAERDRLDEEIAGCEAQLHDLSKKLAEAGVKMVRCPSCGKSFAV